VLLHNLCLVNFKNYEGVNLEFPSKINCLLGLNGSGKTNLLDAIHYLSATRSFLGVPDSQLVRQGSAYFSIQGKFDVAGVQHEIACQVQPGLRKGFSEDLREYEKLSEHIGKYPVVVISPIDIDLVRDGSEMRRKFFDALISQIDTTYLQWLVNYTHVLKQRNSLLGLFAERNFQDNDLLQSFDDQLVAFGNKIATRRNLLIQQFEPLFNAAYAFMVDRKEVAELRYRSTVAGVDYDTALKQSLQKDLAMQRTHVGIHRDDFEFRFEHGELKRLGSQGQQKSFLVAIKLAQLELLAMQKGFCPILLLDDIFDKLDDTRIGRLLERVSSPTTGQLFITDAGSERTTGLLESLQIEAAVFKVNNGMIEQLK
jgi:DNA replication and repair protein RecF